jgi:hypothetical protein
LHAGITPGGFDESFNLYSAFSPRRPKRDAAKLKDLDLPALLAQYDFAVERRAARGVERGIDLHGADVIDHARPPLAFPVFTGNYP